MAVARGSRLGRIASAGSATTTGMSGAKPLAERQRQRQSRKRAAADDNASLCRHVILPLRRHTNETCYLIIAGRNRASKQGLLIRHSGARASVNPDVLSHIGISDSGLRPSDIPE